ncbi:MAG: polyprenyl synthetase family protein [Bifidobacteriaceae bacterium]|jgi:octaprenyl-diphosphate synthase|nr:polyprenyl synthetase family protein [Bifidobacteriaceae bacterium]
MHKLEFYIYKYLTQNLPLSLQPIVKHYIKYPGKHIRAFLVLYGASMGFEKKDLKELKIKNLANKINLLELNNNLLLACLAIEIIHLASLIHDDIIDEAPKRRNKTALHIEFGTKQAVLAGDYLFAKGINLVYKLPPVCKKYIIKAVQDMVFGEFLEAVDGQKNKKNYFTVIDNKTASLFGCSMVIGYLIVQNALVNNKLSVKKISSFRIKEINRIYKWAFNFGKLYQIKDDIDDQEFPF